MLSNVWMIPWSVTNHCCFDSSLVLFPEQVTKQQAEAEPHKGRVLFETFDLTPEEEQSILQSMRSLHD